MKCNKSATKTRRNAAFAVKIKKYFISRAKNLMRGTRSAPGGNPSEGSTHSLKAKKRNGHLVERTEVCYNIFCNAPSPSGKAGDFDSPIVGSTPAGATVEKPARFAAFGQIVRVLFVSGCGAEVCKTGLEGRQGCACAVLSRPVGLSVLFAGKISGDGSSGWACAGASRSKKATLRK